MSALYPCEPWPIDPVCCPDWPEDPAELTPRHRQAQMMATIELWRAVAGVIGLCRVTELPCLDRCTVDRFTRWMTPYRGIDGGYYNALCGNGCNTGCSCRRMCTVTLQAPVHQILEVTVAGNALPASAYKLLTGDRLASCEGCWPTCQDYCAEDGLAVTYLRGIPPGPDAVAAVSKLACLRLNECGSDDDCGQISDSVTSLQREGLSMQFAGQRNEDGGFYLTGIGSVDSWIASINPYGVTAPASVWSPDVPTPQIWRTGAV